LLLAWAALLGLSAAALRETLPPAGPAPSPPGPARYALARIRDTGVLRVGTTGDYDPYSVIDPEGGFRGIDVEAAHLLARAIGPNVQARFVKTSWPGMTRDLLAGRFDVAMGGVSRSRSRGDSGGLSRTYLTDVKVALVRAADRDKYRTLADLDRPGVTVLVNPGGTNQEFVEAKVRRARVMVVRDNLAIPGMVAEGKGDVMFTDGVEARLSARRVFLSSSPVSTNTSQGTAQTPGSPTGECRRRARVRSRDQDGSGQDAGGLLDHLVGDLDSRSATAAAEGGESDRRALRASACAHVDATALILAPRERHRRRSSVFGVGSHEGPRPT
jgi:cyclohexadienyl dehydratase